MSLNTELAKLGIRGADTTGFGVAAKERYIVLADSTGRIPASAIPAGTVGSVAPSDRTYFVDAFIGSDITGDGSVTKPFATITKVLTDNISVFGGTPLVIYLAKGTYTAPSVTNIGQINIVVIGPHKDHVSITGTWSYTNLAGTNTLSLIGVTTGPVSDLDVGSTFNVNAILSAVTSATAVSGLGTATIHPGATISSVTGMTTVFLAATDHGALTGLGDDDHLQYLLTNGTRALTGAMSMGGFKLTSLATPTAATDATNKAYVDAVAAADMANAVLDKDLDTPPGLPSTGDRYIVFYDSFAIVAVGTGTETFEVTGDQTLSFPTSAEFTVVGSTGNDGDYTVASALYNLGPNRTVITVNEDVTNATADGTIRIANGDWNGEIDSIAEWTGAAWFFTAAVEGLTVRVSDENFNYQYSGTAWTRFETTLDHGFLQGLADDDHLQYLIRSGIRPMIGNLDMDGFDIVDVDNVRFLDSTATFAWNAAITSTGKFRVLFDDAFDDKGIDILSDGRLIWGALPAAPIDTDVGTSQVTASIDEVGHILNFRARYSNGVTLKTFPVPETLTTDFLALTDTPNSYAGHALKTVTVNAGETALEFTLVSTDKIQEGDSSVEVIDTGVDGRIIFTANGVEVARMDPAAVILRLTQPSSFPFALEFLNTTYSATAGYSFAVRDTGYLRLNRAFGSTVFVVEPVAGNMGVGPDFGISVPTPLAQFHVIRAASGGQVGRFTQTDTASKALVLDYAPGAVPGFRSWGARVDASGNLNLTYDVDGADTFSSIFTQGGALGISQPIPTAKLHILDAATAFTALTILEQDDEGVNALVLRNAAGVDFDWKFRVKDSDTLQIRNNSDVERLWLQSAGYLGVSVPATAPTDGDISANQAVAYLDETNYWLIWRGKLSDSTFQSFRASVTGQSAKKENLTAHGFVVGDVLRKTSGSWAKAQANSVVNSASTAGIVIQVIDANNFVIAFHGYVTGLSGLTDGSVHWLSPTTAGAFTTTQPSTSGQVIKEILIGLSTTTAMVRISEGAEIP
jgi:hypothetical protein